MKTTKHPYADVIIHWGEGGAIQWRDKGSVGKWNDYLHDFTSAPAFGTSSGFEWRIKPTMKRYQVGEVDISNGETTLIVVGNVEAETYWAERSTFKRWITNWIEYE